MAIAHSTLEVQYRQNRFAVASGCEHSILKLRPNLRFQSWPWHLLATASSSALRQRLTHLSLRWSEERAFRGRARSINISPRMGEEPQDPVALQSESTNDKYKVFFSFQNKKGNRHNTCSQIFVNSHSP